MASDEITICSRNDRCRLQHHMRGCQEFRISPETSLSYPVNDINDFLLQTAYRKACICILPAFILSKCIILPLCWPLVTTYDRHSSGFASRAAPPPLLPVIPLVAVVLCILDVMTNILVIALWLLSIVSPTLTLSIASCVKVMCL